MLNWQKVLILLISLFVLSGAAYGQEITKKQVKGLDEQVQEIKKDVLNIAVALNQLEEKLLYPSNTQVSFFVSMETGETFRLDSVEIKLDGKKVSHHLYTYKQLEALQKGGVQNIYTGNVRTGEHDLEVFVLGKTEGGTDIKQSARFTFNKEVSPRVVEISLTAQQITFKE